MFVIEIDVLNEGDHFSIPGTQGIRHLHEPCADRAKVEYTLATLQYDGDLIFTDEEIRTHLEHDIFNTETGMVPLTPYEPYTLIESPIKVVCKNVTGG